MTDESAQRKLTTILAADIAGYSRLSAADEEATLRTLKSYREIIDRLIARHEGRIFSTGGDSVFAEFGSAVEAVRSAMAIQEELRVRNAELVEDRRMVFRIGINVGDVMVDGDNLLGDGVNVAARLEGIAEPGGICISGSTFDHVKNRLSVGFEDIGPQSVKNIPDPVPTFRIVEGPVTVAPSPPPQSPRPTRRWRMPAVWVSAAALLLVIVAAGAWLVMDRFGSSTVPELSLVVLPFSNLSGDASQDYLADVITDQLTTYLSRIPGTFVIARNTAFTFKGKPVDVKRVGKDLGVRYVLEGSVQPVGDRVRVNAQLIDAESGAHLWAETFDKKQSDRLRMQDEIVTRISRALHIQLSAIEAARLERPEADNPDAEAVAMKCEAILIASTPAAKSMQAGYRLCEQALQIDPHNVRALGVLSIKYGIRVAIGRSRDLQGDKKLATELASRALAADPKSYMAHFAQSYALSIVGKYEEAMVESQRVLDLNPSFVSAFFTMCAGGLYTGQPEKTVEWATTAIRLSPRDPGLVGFHLFAGRANFMMRKDDKAIEWLRKSVAQAPNFTYSNLHLAAVLGATGREIEAAEVLKTYLLLKRTTDKTIAQWKRQLRTKNPDYVATFERLTEGLRKAGMPEK